MTDSPVALAVAAAAIRAVFYALSWRLRLAREHANDKMLITFVQAAGPGSTVVDRRVDGRVLAVWTQGPALEEYQDCHEIRPAGEPRRVRS